MTSSNGRLLRKKPIRRRTANQVTFEVDPRANRIEVQRAVEKIFNVKVADIRTMHVRGKFKRRGRIWANAAIGKKPSSR
jgi:large subunit ribosomal protein L23